MNNILVTGGAGFIGSNFINYFIHKYPNYNIINLDLLTYAADLDNLKLVENNPRYQFVQGDIYDRILVEQIFEKYEIDGVIHFAAESHVDQSIKNPDIFIKTNVNGSFTLIDAAFHHWMNRPFEYKKQYTHCRFHHISTDEVYGSLGKDGKFTENSPYSPNSPYAASKASSDMIIRSYSKTYGLNTIMTNCSNNYGKFQNDEKLIPTIIRNAIKGEAIPIYGDGKNIRDWLYVDDHCKALDLVFNQGVAGQVYNIGGDCELENNFIAKSICEILDKKIPNNKSYKEQICYVEDRFGHDRRYAIDCSKIKKELGWRAAESFENGIEKTIDWFIGKYER